MLLSRTKSAFSGDSATSHAPKKEIPTLEAFLMKRDFTGAMTLMEFEKSTKGKDIKPDCDAWIAYCAFHLGDYKRAADVYAHLLKKRKADPNLHVYLSCCHFFLGSYEEAHDMAKKAPDSSLKNRILFHCAQKFNDERLLLNYHNMLADKPEDQLCLASIHWLRNHNQSAIDIYKRIILEDRELYALNVYIALSYYKIDYLDAAHEYLGVYLQHFPDSATAINLKACINFKLYDGRTAEAELKVLQDVASPSFTYARDVIKHNTVVFRGGEGALQVLPPLIGVLPEARLNLIIYHMKKDEVDQAFELAKDIEPFMPYEYILKGVVFAAMGQRGGAHAKENLKSAQQYFQLIGSSAGECDTIIGRQCMASCFFLLKQFEDVLMYLDSIKVYFTADDNFNFNYGQAKAAVGAYREALESFEAIQSEELRQDYTVISWMARCHIMSKQPKQAWELYLRMDTTNESFSLLQLIADDCYRTGAFYYSAKAFDVLDRLDPLPRYWEGKRGACIGLFQLIIDGRESRDKLRDIIILLHSSNNPQSESITRIIRQWAKENSAVTI